MRLIEVTWHAVEQFRARFPLEAGSASSIRLLIAGEVEASLEGHRYSAKQPPWARLEGRRTRGRRNGKEIDRTMRYVWTENKQRLYLVDKHGRAVRVVTSILPQGSGDRTDT